MFIRCVFLLFFPCVLVICGQEPAGLAPPKPYRAQLEESGPVREISLRDAIQTALRYNLEIEIEGYNRQVSQASTVNVKSYYDPVAGLSTSYVSSDLPVTNILQTGGFGSQITRSWSATPSIQQNLPGGGAATLTSNLSRTTTNTDYALINPVYGSTLGLTITQPLWRGFLRTQAERQIIVARLNEQMSESQFRQRATGVVEQAINAYWRLAVTIENYEAQRQGWDVAMAEYEQARKQNEDGKDAPSAASQRSELASHDQNVSQAAVQIIQASNALKRLLAPSVTDPVWGVGLIPSDRPGSKEFSMNLDEAVKTAMDRRPELDQLRLQVKQSDAEVRYDRQEAKPSVNLRLEALSTANTGPIRNIPEGSTPPATGALGTSYRQALGFQHPSLAAGVEIKVPLRNTAAKSQLTAAVLGGRKLQTQLRAAQEDILVEVRNAWESIAVQRKNVEAVGFSRRLAEQHLAAETAKSRSDAQNLEILRNQRDLADARVREMQALIDYQLSLISLQKAINTLLDEQQIVLARPK
jgi:outer membrane protein TolC